MRRLILLLLTVSMSLAQETRRTVATASPAEDARPNSDQVPDVYAITGHFDRVVVLRLKYQTDLLAGMLVTIGVMNDVDFRRIDDEHYR